MDKKAQREAMIRALVDDVEWWDRDRITEKAKAKVEEELQQCSDSDLTKAYNEAFSED